MTPQEIAETADKLEFAWAEWWADEVVTEQAAVAVLELRKLVQIIRSDRY